MMRKNIAGIDDALATDVYYVKDQPPDFYDWNLDGTPGEVKIDPPALPIYPGDFETSPGAVIDPNPSPILYKTFTYSGTVVNEINEPVPGASIYLLLNGEKIAGVVADSNGNFSVTAQQQPTSIVISSTGYVAWEWTADPAQNIYQLKIDVKDLDPVDLPPGKKANYSWLALLLLIPLLKEEKKKVGKIEMSTVLAIGAGLGIVLGFDTIVKILRELGIGQTKEGQDYDDQVSDPGSFWSPAFWKTGGAGTKILTNADVISINDQIINAFHWYNDDEAAVTAAFKRMHYQSQLSYFADWFAGYQGQDLLKWLKGSDIWPDDRLSVAHIAEITNYFKQLPKYR